MIPHPQEEEKKNEWWIVALILGAMFLCAWAFSGCAEKPHQVYWGQVVDISVIKDGKPLGCLQPGYDDHGFMRWSVNLCPKPTDAK